MESNLNRTFSLLKARGMIQSGDLVIALSLRHAAAHPGDERTLDFSKIWKTNFWINVLALLKE